MKKPQTEPAVYLVLANSYLWRGKRCAKDTFFEVKPTDDAQQQKQQERKLQYAVAQGEIRLSSAAENAASQANPQTSCPTPKPWSAGSPSAGSPNSAQQAGTPAELVYAKGAVLPFIVCTTAVANQVQTVPIGLIRPDPTQPRKDFTGEQWEELVASVKQIGIEMAIRVRPMSRWRQIVSFVARQWAKRQRKEEGYGIAAALMRAEGIEATVDDELGARGWMKRLIAEGRVQKSDPQSVGYVPTAGALAPLTGETTLPGEDEWLEIVYGERRWRACQAAGLTTIPAKVRELSDLDAGELQAIENLDRAALKPVEEAGQFHKLLYRTAGYTIERLEKVTGIKRNTIYSKLKLLDLPEEPRKFLDAGKLGSVTAQRIGRLKDDPQVQARAIELILHPQDDDEEILSDRDAQIAIEQAQQEVGRERQIAAAKENAIRRGLKWLEGKEREKIMGYNRPHDHSGMVSLDMNVQGDPEYRTYNQIFGKKPGRDAAKVIKPTMVTVVHGKLMELYVRDDVMRTLRDAGVVFKSKREASANSEEAKRRRRDKLMKSVLNRAASHIRLRSQLFCPLSAQTPQMDAMWRALARCAVAAVKSDDLRAFVRRRGIEPVRRDYGHGGAPVPQWDDTIHAFLEGKRTSELAGIASELLMLSGAWWSHSTDFKDSFLKGAEDFGIDLAQLKREEGGGTEDELGEAVTEVDVGDDESANARTEDESVGAVADR